MFFRTKQSGTRSYLQVVENRWEDGRPRQRVIATLGRLDQLQQSGQLDALLVSGARLAHSVLLLSAHAKGQVPTITTRRIGPASTGVTLLALLATVCFSAPVVLALPARP